jgi:hypothetical protein
VFGTYFVNWSLSSPAFCEYLAVLTSVNCDEIKQCRFVKLNMTIEFIVAFPNTEFRVRFVPFLYFSFCFSKYRKLFSVFFFPVLEFFIFILKPASFSTN